MNKKLTASGSQSLLPAWQFSLNTTYDPLTRPPIVAGDRLVCVSKSAVFALNIYTGEEFNVEDGFPVFLQPSRDATPPLTHSRGILYFMDGGELVARQLSDGKIPTRRDENRLVPRWKAPSLKNVVSVRASDDVVIVFQAKPDTRVTGFDAVTGARLWEPVIVSQSSSGRIEATRDAIVFDDHRGRCPRPPRSLRPTATCGEYGDRGKPHFEMVTLKVRSCAPTLRT